MATIDQSRLARSDLSILHCKYRLKFLFVAERIGMWSRLCRVCLVTDVRMLSMEPHVAPALHAAYTELTGVLSTSGAHYACYECARLLTRAHRLKLKSLRAHELLQAALLNMKEITKATIEGIDRASNQLTSSLGQRRCDSDVVIELVYDENKAFMKEELEEKEKTYDSTVWLLDVDRVKVEDGNASEWERELVSSASSVAGSSHGSDDEQPLLAISRTMRRRRTKGAEQGVPQAAAKSAEVAVSREELLRKKREKLAALMHEADEEPVTKKRKHKVKKETSKMKEKRSKRFDASAYEEFSTVVFMSKEEAVEEIRKRLESSNYLMSTYRCELCYRGFWQVDSYNNHMQKHDPKMGDHECDVCRLRFESRRSMQHHQSNFHRTKFICNKCPHYCTNPPLARRHEDWHKGKVYTCKHCNEHFKRVSTLQSHVRRLHASEFACELCGLSFVGQRGIIAHKNRMHREKQREEVQVDGPHCAECDITFANEEAWKRHLVISAKHRGETTNGCEICGETFPSADELKQHHRSHARKYPALYLHKKKNNGIVWPVECEQCKASIGSSQEYKSHFQKVHPDKNRTHFPVWRSSYMCETCGRIFRNQALLGYHQRKHSGDKPFKCASCPKSFHHASYLAAHTRMHTGTMPFECQLCGKRFNYKNNLERHMNIHSGLKPHKCEYCGKCFTQSSERKSHIDYVHHKKPWPKRDRGQRGKCDAY